MIKELMISDIRILPFCLFFILEKHFRGFRSPALYFACACLFDYDMDHIPVFFSDPCADALEHPYDIADRTISVFHTHIDDAAVIRDSVKNGMHHYSPFSKLFPYIPGERDICAAVVLQLMQDCIVLILTHDFTAGSYP